MTVHDSTPSGVPPSPTQSLEIVVGTRWIEDAGSLETGDAALWVGNYDYDVLVAPVDVVLAGRNLTADLRDEPVLAFIEAWAAAAARLAAGGRRAKVEFTESPVEIALERDGQSVLVSVFELGAPGHFRAERCPIANADFVRAVAELCARCADAAAGRADALVHRAESAAGRVPAMLPYVAPLERPTDWVGVTTRGSCGLEFATTFCPGTTGMQSAIGALRFDRHVLLVSGHVEISDASGRRARFGSRPLRLIEQMIDSLAPMARRAQLDQPTTLLTETATGRVELRVLDRERARISVVEGPRTTEFQADALDIARLVFDHAEAVAACALDVNPALQANALLTELQDISVQLRRRLRVAARPVAPRPLVFKTPSQEPIAPPGAAFHGYDFSADRIRHMRYERSWTLSLTDARPRTLRTVAPGLFAIAHRHGVDVLRARDGGLVQRVPMRAEQRMLSVGASVVMLDDAGIEHASLVAPVSWRVASDLASSAVAATVGAGAVIVASRAGACAAFAVDDGRPQWSSAELFGAAGGIGMAGETAVLSHPGLLRGLHIETGEERWRTVVPFERIAFRCFGTVVLVVADDPLAASALVGVLNAETGAWMRRHEVAADVRAVGWSSEMGAAVLLSGAEGTQLLAVGAMRGIDWGTPIPWSADGSTRPRVRLDADGLGVVMSTGRRLARVQSGGVVWTLDTQDHPDARGFGLARRNASDGLEFVVGETGIQVVESTKGRVLHAIPPFWEELAGLAADERGNLLVVEHIPDGANRLHGVGAVGLIATLEGGLAAS